VVVLAAVAQRPVPELEQTPIDLLAYLLVSAWVLMYWNSHYHSQPPSTGQGMQVLLDVS